MACIWRENMLGYLFGDVVDCYERRTVFRELEKNWELRGTKSTVFMENYPCYYQSQMEAIMFIILQIFLATHGSFEYWGMSLGFSLGHILSRKWIAPEGKYLMEYKYVLFFNSVLWTLSADINVLCTENVYQYRGDGFGYFITWEDIWLTSLSSLAVWFVNSALKSSISLCNCR